MMIVITLCTIVVIFFTGVAIFGNYKAEEVQDVERPDTRNVRTKFSHSFGHLSFTLGTALFQFIGRQCPPWQPQPCLSRSKRFILDHCCLCLHPHNTIRLCLLGFQDKKGQDQGSQWCKIHRCHHLCHHRHYCCNDCVCCAAQQAS